MGLSVCGVAVLTWYILGNSILKIDSELAAGATTTTVIIITTIFTWKPVFTSWGYETSR